MKKFRLIIPKIEIEFEADSFNQAIGMVDDGTIDTIGEMHAKQKILEIKEDKITHSITVRENQFNNLDPLHRQWWCSCGKILHTESDMWEHAKLIKI